MVLVIRKRLLLLTGILVCACVTAVCCFQGVAPVSATPRLLPIYGVNTTEQTLALTFDCAWENSDTDRLLTLLGQYGVPATFFTTGDWCDRYPEDVKRLFAAGHAIENHSYAHPHPNKLSPDELVADTQRCDQVIVALTGKSPTLYRLPYGEYNNTVMATFRDRLPHRVIQWDVDSRDWQKRSAEEMARDVIAKVRPGSILLFHNDTENTPEALELILPALQAQGYTFTLVEDMLLEIFTLDHAGRQNPM